MKIENALSQLHKEMNLDGNWKEFKSSDEEYNQLRRAVIEILEEQEDYSLLMDQVLIDMVNKNQSFQ